MLVIKNIRSFVHTSVKHSMTRKQDLFYLCTVVYFVYSSEKFYIFCLCVCQVGVSKDDVRIILMLWFSFATHSYLFDTKTSQEFPSFINVFVLITVHFRLSRTLNNEGLFSVNFCGLNKSSGLLCTVPIYNITYALVMEQNIQLLSICIQRNYSLFSSFSLCWIKLNFRIFQ